MATTSATRVAAAIILTIPDNEARTAYSTLRRLGVAIGNLHRATVVLLDQPVEPAEAEAAIRRHEALFNENTNDLWVGHVSEPGPGELWVTDDRPQTIDLGALGKAQRLLGWRLTDASGAPVALELVNEAADVLLCNPAFQRRILDLHDIPLGEKTTR